MQKNNIQGIVLAAGKSTRLKTGRSKLLEPICGREMVSYPTKLLDELDMPITMIIGYQGDLIKKALDRYKFKDITFVEQKEQKGTGHALLCSKKTWSADDILIINGDAPLVHAETIEKLCYEHTKNNATISFVTANHSDPLVANYGRVIKEKNIIKIVEPANFTGDDVSESCWINGGIYLVKKDFLEKAIDDIPKDSISKEFYLTDLVRLAGEKKHTIKTVSVPFDCIRGINTMYELWAAEQIKRSQLIRFWMGEGVRFELAQNAHIDSDVKIGAGTRVCLGSQLLGTTSIGKGCTIGSHSIILNSTLEDNVTVLPYSYIVNSKIYDNAQVGPFVHIKNSSEIKPNATIGNFVEIKKSIIGQNTKAKHLSYIGDTTIGSNVNIGAGTITCNHNGKQKNKIKIEDNAYIGSNSSLIAPIKIGKGAFTAAGSVINKNVPENALAIARSRQENKADYANKIIGKTTRNKKENKDEAPFIGAIKSKDATTISTE